MSARPTQPPSALVCDAVTFAAALWTIGVHVTVAAGGSLHDALAAVAGIATLSGIGFAYAVRRGAFRNDPAPPDSPAPAPVRDEPLFRLAGALMGAGTVALYARGGSVVVLWWGCVAALVVGAAWLALRSPQPAPLEPARAGPWREAALWSLALLCAVLALAFHRTDLDTPFYVSLAVAAADAPGAPILRDAIHGIDGLRLHQPAHRVHTFEIWNGALSYLTGWPAIYCYQVVTAAASAALVPLALARLCRLLAPRAWLFLVVAALVVIVGGGGTRFWYGNFSIVRIFHGKSVYLSVFLPLAYAYGMRFAASPTPARWLRLCAVQIAAVGCTSSALWSVPIAAGLAAASAVRWDRRAARTLALAAASSVYVVAVGASLVGDMTRVASTVTPDDALGAGLEEALGRALGGGTLEWFALAALALTWTVYRRGPAQRFAIVIPLVVLVSVLNPYCTEQVRRYVTGPSFWRGMWGLPLPLLMALLLAAPTQLRRSGAGRAAGALLTAAAVVAFAAIVPRYSTLSVRNGSFPGGFPRLTVPEKFYPAARALSEHAPPGSSVLAPEKVAIWVPSFHHHPSVVYAREVYLQRIRAERGAEEADLRMHMSEAVSYAWVDVEERIRLTQGFWRRLQDPGTLKRFREGLRRFDVGGVAVNQRAPLLPELQDILKDEGFALEEKRAGYQIWIRP